MRDVVNILGVNVDRVTFEAALKAAKEYLDGSTPRAIYTPNSEIIMAAYRDERYRNTLNNADMVIPDGIGVVYGAKILKKPLYGRVTGYDLSCALLEHAGKCGMRVFLYGGKPGIAEIAAEKIHKKYNVTIAGTENGYLKDDSGVPDKIRASRADMVLVCLGFPRQEYWIEENKEKTGAKVLIGAGGSIDAFAGTVKRAPVFFQKANLEWLYRLLKQPSRAKRMLELPRFAIKVITKGKRQG